MKNKIKRFLLCLLAVSMATVSGAVKADGEEETAAEVTEEASAEEEPAGDAAAQKPAKLKETEEKVKAEASDIEAYLPKIGTIEGLDIYLKDKDFDDAIWEKNGGKPAKKKDYTEEQEALSDVIDELKKLGDLIAIDAQSGEAVASFKDSSKVDDGLMYVSEAGRYLLTVDKDKTKPLKLMEVISTIDDPQLFRSADGKTLELTDSNYKKVTETYTYSGKENGRTVFYNADKSAFAWLSEDEKKVEGTFTYAAENDKFRMLVDQRLANIGLENKETGYIWWSSPLEATRDQVATPLLISELRSSNTLRYGIPERRSNNNVVRSGTDDCTITVSKINNGIKAVYDFQKAGFKYPVEYVLEDDHLKASVKVAEIQESNAANIATELTVLGSFGAADMTEEGYFVVPDGSGALVRFNNQKTMDTNAYQQRVYGSDVTVVPTSKGAVTEQVYLPVYGIVKEDNACLVVASKGDSNAVLSAQVSKQSNSSYNLCSFTFILRGTDTFYMSGNSNDKLTVFESGAIKSDDIELRYYPIAKEGADYTDIAARYRQYLTEEAGVSAKTEAGKSPMYVDLYGGTQKKKPVLGIPVTMKQKITTYDQAGQILSQLKNSGVDDIVVSYNNWTNDGIKNKVDTEAKPSGTLGGKSDFKGLTDLISQNGFELYPSSDDRDFYSGNGYYSFTSTAVRVSGSYSRIISYDRAYGIPDGFKKNMSLLSPSLFDEVYSDVADNYSKAGLSGVSIGNMTTSLYGDYGKKNISRAKAMDLICASYDKLGSSLSEGILADAANAYALPYVSHITSVPLNSSRFDLFNEDIPFYQMVMHGLIPYSTTAVNGDADPTTLLLMAAATGSGLSYDMLYEETSVLKDTEFDVLYYANYLNWTDTASREYKLLQPLLSKVSSCTIDGYEADGDLITTTYSDGTVVKVDLQQKTVEYDGNTLSLENIDQEGGAQENG